MLFVTASCAGKGVVRYAWTSSLPGLARQSIYLQQDFFEEMDHRVKPGDDSLILPDGQIKARIQQIKVQPFPQKYSDFPK